MNEAENWNYEVTHPLQSWEWGEFRKQKQPISRVNGMLVVWTKVKYTPWCFGYIPMGRWPEEKDIGALEAEGVKMGAIGVRLEPNVFKNDNLIIDERLRKGRHLFKTKTFILDLTLTEEELLKRMHQKGRYNIKIAQKHGVTVRKYGSPETFEKYLDLMFSGTAKRQKIYSHGRDYHRLMWKSLKENIAHLFVAEYEKEVIAASIIFKFKEGIYYAYGASALEHKEVMAPTLLLWVAAKWGKNQGCKFFDLWGAEEGKGFSRFKEQFGGKTVELVGSYDLPVNIPLYPLFRLAEEIRWKILRILK
jgi:lipid II:glycine glycyltransferase (peptidoglycan interpeptide bridge formation enzyme)